MCPNCRAFIDASDRVCPYCEVKVGPRAVERRSPTDIAGIIPGAQFTTAMILLVNIGLFIATIVLSRGGEGNPLGGPDGRTLLMFGAKEPNFIVGYGQLWRLVTAGFLHGGFIHILMNSWALFSLGGEVEQVYGTARFIVFYFMATVCGFIASTWWSPSLSVGASAGIFGLLGVMLAFGMQHRGAGGAAVRAHYGQWVVWGLITSFLPGIDMGAHFGGLAAGFALAYIAGAPKLYESWRDTAWKVAAGICLALTAYCFFRMFIFLTGVLNSSPS